MQALRVQHYIRRATDFSRGVILMRDEQDYLNSSALLAIHCAISYLDALRVGLGDQNLSADDHTKAIEALRKLVPSSRMEDQSGFTHLQYVISKKSLVAYGSRRLEAKDLDLLLSKSERFAKWANSVGKQLKIEGWQSDD